MAAAWAALLLVSACTARSTSTPVETCDDSDPDCALKTAAECEGDKDCASASNEVGSDAGTRPDDDSDTNGDSGDDAPSSGGTASDDGSGDDDSGDDGSDDGDSLNEGGTGTTSEDAGTSSQDEDAGVGGTATGKAGGSGQDAAGGGDNEDGGSGGNGSGGANAGSGGSDMTEESPCGSHRGSPMAMLDASTGSFCVDTFEVTREQYAEFLNDEQSATLPDSCSFKTDHTPGDAWPISGDGDRPVAYVDWCDAYAYCSWAGKRLCGAVSGGPYGTAATDSSAGQWYAACSTDGTNAYPYGPQHNGTYCVGVDFDGTPGYTVGSDHTLPPGSAPGCRGTSDGYDEVRDMSGNVAEWEDACGADFGPDDACRARGGDFWTGIATTMRCRDAIGRARNFRGVNIGFRCCADL